MQLPTFVTMAAEGGHIPVVAPTAGDGVFDLIWLVIALPLLGAAILLLGGRSARDRWGHLLGTALPVGSFVISLMLFFGLLGRDEDERQIGQHLYDWIQRRRASTSAWTCSTTRCRRCSCC